MFRFLSATMLSSLCFVAPAWAQSEAAKQFGAREYIQQISLAPSGSKVAMLTPLAGRDTVLMIGDLVNGGDPKPILRSDGNKDQLTHCHWSTDVRLICSIYIITNNGIDNIGFTRVVSLNSDGSDLKILSARESSRALGIMQQGGEVVDWLTEGDGSVLMTRQFVAEGSTGTHLASARAGLGVEKVDTTTLSRKIVEQPREGAVEYISDGHGTVRIMGVRSRNNTGYDGNRIVYFYRKAGDRSWLPFGELQLGAGTTRGFAPVAVDRDLDLVYGFDDQDGRTALFSIALDGSMKRSLVFARADVDVAGLVEVGRQGRAVGASFVTDRRQTEFFDPELKRLRTALAKAVPGKPLVSFVDASADESKLLLFAGSDVSPGTYYVFDKAAKSLAEVMPVRPALEGKALSPVKSVTFPAADGTQIPAYLTLPPGSDGKNLPAIVMPHGGPGARDEWGFDWLAQFFAARGFAVLQPNFRGSTGYGEAWFQNNGFQSWRTAIGDVNAGGHWLVAQGIAKADKLAIVGWSYGGYAALQSSVLEPDLFKAIVAVAPVTDLDTLREESRNFTSYAMVDTFIGHGPHVREGSPAQNAARIKAPVLLFHGDVDQNVGVGESRLMASKLRGAGGKVELVEFHNLDHQLDDSNARTQLLDKADQFLRASLGL